MSSQNHQNSTFLEVSQSPSSLNNKKIKVVAGFGLQEKLGSGSFAVVYKGVRLEASNDPNPSLEDTVAIKAIARNSDKLTPKVLHNLEKEISILRTYRHRNIVCMHEVRTTTNHFYLILEYCAGGDLQHLIRDRKNGRLTEPLCRRLMRDLCGGLKFLNRHQLIHRDIKPQNLLLTGALPLDEINDPCRTEALELSRTQINFPTNQFVLKIADFGFARHLQTTSLAETLCGSPLYMAPEILSHQRYDEKADLWSVGTVLFEMISGKPPFNGDNHIHLLQNIKNNAVRLPVGVRVCKEGVNLLRILLNRNPQGRASFTEFVNACDSFVSLGCNGVTTIDEGSAASSDNLKPGGQNESHSMMTVEEMKKESQTLTGTSNDNQNIITPLRDYSSTTVPPMTVSSSNLKEKPTDSSRGGSTLGMLNPLSPNPPGVGQSPILGNVYTIPEIPIPYATRSNISAQTHIAEKLSSPRRNESQGSLQNSTDDFVMVEHGSSVHKTADMSTKDGVIAIVNDNYYTMQQDNSRYRLQQSPPSSPAFAFRDGGNIIPSQPGDYMITKHEQRLKGMLSTSPGTGGALMGLLMGRGNGMLTETGEANRTEKQSELQIKSATKMLAASEDVGRRAVSVAHLGDHRAVHGIKLFMMMDSASSSMLSTTPMEGIGEEDIDNIDSYNNNTSGAVTDDSGCTEIMASGRYRRQRSSFSTTDKFNMDTKGEDDMEEMPFALQSESPPILSAGIPTRTGSSINKGTYITSSRQIKPTPSMVRSHFSEALLCYVKALKMLKGAFGAVEGVIVEVDNLLNLSTPLSTDQREHLLQVKRRSEVSKNWLGAQFNGVLERGDAANVEIRKFPITPSINPETGPNEAAMVPGVPIVSSVEELIYNQSLALGREGAVKQLLGQNEQARSCYRSAGLLAETLLMDSKNVTGNDRKILEGYVDAFATQISELDTILQQQLTQSRLIGGTGGNAGIMSMGGSSLRQHPAPQRMLSGGSYGPAAILPLSMEPS